MQHLVDIAELSAPQIASLLAAAEAWLQAPWLMDNFQTPLRGKTVGLLFLENSTRTLCSFELAAKRLGAHVINLDVNTSSLAKRESLIDTALTLMAMRVDALVVRSNDEEACQQLCSHAKIGQAMAILNAGAGRQHHPSQALLDLLTMQQTGKAFADLNVALLGDVIHSRVAHSLCVALTTMGCQNIRLVGPELLIPQDNYVGLSHGTTDMQQGLKGVDVAVVLRPQLERMPEEHRAVAEAQAQAYQFLPEHLAIMAEDAIVMHPGPVNRDVEIASAVVDGPKSRILNQVKNGVAVRAALLDWALSKG